ncbi:MYCT protein, partial [Polypterus senegalus]|nr:MYCT protein [Polypterus senegalus]
MGEKRRNAKDDSGERSLIKAASSSSINSQGPAPPVASTCDLERAARKQFQEDVTPAFVFVLAGFSALGGFLFGYDTGVVSGAMLLLKKEMNLSALWQELLVSSTVGSAALSALAGGVLNGLFGRRPCILLASFLFSLGAIVLMVAPNKEVLLVGRIIVGLGIGKSDRPVYVSCHDYISTSLNSRSAQSSVTVNVYILAMFHVPTSIM